MSNMNTFLFSVLSSSTYTNRYSKVCNIFLYSKNTFLVWYLMYINVVEDGNYICHQLPLYFIGHFHDSSFPCYETFPYMYNTIFICFLSLNTLSLCSYIRPMYFYALHICSVNVRPLVIW